MMKNSNPWWKVIFITLLIINVIFIAWSQYVGSQYMGEMSIVFGVIPLALPLAIIDLIAIVFYIVKHHHQGKASITRRVILDIIL